jgi:hypothetical protein
LVKTVCNKSGNKVCLLYKLVQVFWETLWHYLQIMPHDSAIPLSIYLRNTDTVHSQRCASTRKLRGTFIQWRFEDERPWTRQQWATCGTHTSQNKW